MDKSLLGTTRRDTVTGMTGKVTGVAAYTDHADQCQLTSLDTTGRPVDYWVPIARTTETVPVPE